MDGNQRWAKKKNKKIIDGYLEGLNNLKNIIEFCIKEKIKYVSVYALSSENNNRNSSLLIFNIIRQYFNKIIDDFDKKKINFKIIGEKNNIPKDIIKLFEKYSNQVTEAKLNLNILFNYGLDYEIQSIISRILKRNQSINKENIRSNMYLGNIPDPDILIRTGGYQRLSNFMPLNLAYTELFFTETLWPELKIDEVNLFFNKFKKIKRNYGL